MTHKVLCSNQKTESCVYILQRSHALFDIKCFPVFVDGSEVILDVLSTRLLILIRKEKQLLSLIHYFLVIPVKMKKGNA